MANANRLSGIFDVLRPMAWIALVSLVALSSRAIGHDWFLMAALWLALAVSAGLWAARQPWVRDAKRPFERRAGIALSVLFVPILTYLVALLAGVALERTSAERYTSAREAFMTDQEGFPFIKSFALEHYGVHVVLASAVSGWATSSVALPHAGAAFMSVGPGYCELTLNRANVLRGFNGDDPSAWVKGVMVHELAHCLDVSRDMPAFTGRKIGTLSIAPSEAGEVADQVSPLGHRAVASAPVSVPVSPRALASALPSSPLLALPERRPPIPDDSPLHGPSCYGWQDR